jgi:photosystem II stability/assembly factor-like uncharacterized protein
MMNTRRFTFVVMALVLSSLSMILFVPSTRGQGDTWSETFDDPALPGWNHSPGVSVVEGVLHIEPGNFAARGGDWADFSLSLSLRLSGPGGLALIYHVGEGGSHILLLNNRGIEFQRESGGQVVSLNTVPQTVSQGEWHQLQLNVAGETHTVTLDGAQVLNVTDTDSPVRAGGVSFETLGEMVAEVDNLMLSSAPQEQPPAPAPFPEQPAQVPPGEVGVWFATGGPPGGLGYDIRYNFADPDIWYVTDSFAGLFISTDNGLTWQPSVNGIPGQAGATGDIVPIFCVTVDPLNPQIVWTGTQNTGHIYKSVDGGLTWTQADNGVTIQYDSLSFRGVTVDPRSSDIVYAMAETTRNVPNPDETGGIIYKTVDGGQHWDVIWDGGMPSSLARYMWIDPRNPDVLYVSTGIFDRGAVSPSPDSAEQYLGGLGILKSTDGGQTWRELNAANGLGLLFVGSLYMYPDNPDILLAAAGHLSQTDLAGHLEEQGAAISDQTFPVGIYRITDGGENWTLVLRAPQPQDIFTSVEMCPTHPDIAYAASWKSVFRSEDAGQTWLLVSGGTPLGWGAPGFVAGFPIDLQCDPRDPNRVFANNYGGGNFLSEDGGRTWNSASQGYSGALTADVAVDPFHRGRIYAVARSGIWRSDDYGTTWIPLNYMPPDSLDAECLGLAVDPSRPDHVLLGCTPEVILESEDAGESWQFRERLPKDNFPEIGLFPTAGVLVFAPSDPNTVYAGTNWRNGILIHEPGLDSSGIFVSHDGGTSWQATANDQLQRAAVFDLAVDPATAQVVFAALETGLVKTTDGGEHWAPVSGLPDGRVRAVAISPNDSQYVLAGLDGMGIYASSDGGNSWQPSNAGLEPNGSLHSIVFDPANPQNAYASDHASGVYRSTDGGHTWIRINDGLTNRAATGLTISPDGQYLFVATDGQGVYRLALER